MSRWQLTARFWVPVACLIGIHFVVVATNARLTFPVVDELAHLPSGVAHLKHGDFSYYRVNPPLPRMVAALPVVLCGTSPRYLNIDYGQYADRLRPEFHVGFNQLHQAGLGLANDFYAPRVACFLFSLVGGLTLGCWVRSVAGDLAGVVSLGLWVFSPNIIANASVVGPDLAATSMGMVACYLTWRWSENRRLASSVFAGVGLGLAMLCKSTWILGLVTLPFVFLVATRPRCRSEIRKAVIQVPVFIVVALLVTNAGYLFRGSFERVDSFTFRSEAFGGPEAAGEATGNRFSGTLIGHVPSLLPRDYLLGIDFLKSEVEQRMTSFLAGQRREGSWWYYYLVAVALKTPLGTLLLAAIATPMVVLSSMRRPILLHLGLPVLAIFAAVSMAGGFNHHHRYILPVYGLLFALAGCAFSPLAPRTRLWWWVRSTALVASVVGSAIAVPYFHSYFNVLAGGPYHGYRWLTYSNVEWGQDLLRVGAWIDEHAGDRLVVVQSGYPADPENLFGPETESGDQMRLILANPQKRKVLKQHGMFLILHSTVLSDRPFSEVAELAESREPVEWIAPSHRVYFFQGNDDFELLENVYR